MTYNKQQFTCDLCGNTNYGKRIVSLNLFFCAHCLQTQARKINTLINNFSGIYPGPIFYNKTQSNWGGDSEVPEIKFSNGDTEEWTKLEFKGLERLDFDQAIGIVKLAIASSDKNFDSKRNCWFIRTSLVDTLIIGFNSLASSINAKQLKYHSGYNNIKVLDQREKYESFDEFFNTPPPMGASKLRSKDDLIKAFGQLLETKFIPMPPEAMSSLDTAKKLYRKAALAFHPDRNNGDGTKMSELNMIWNELQQRF